MINTEVRIHVSAERVGFGKMEVGLKHGHMQIRNAIAEPFTVFLHERNEIECNVVAEKSKLVRIR